MKYKVEKIFDHKGLKCVVIMHELGHRCGYVGIPKEHPLYGIRYDEKCKYLPMADLKNEPVGKRGIFSILSMALSDEDKYVTPEFYFDVHGSITYSGGDPNYPIKSDLWWFGFDCAHCDDAPDLEAAREYGLMDDKTYAVYLRNRLPNGTVRTLDYCIEECKRLAEQLIKVADKKNNEANTANGRLFKVIDKQTGKEADIQQIVQEDWAYKLVYTDVIGFLLGDDGCLYLADSCGNFVPCDLNRFEVAISALEEEVEKIEKIQESEVDNNG